MNFQSYKTGDESEILRLFSMSFGKNLPKQSWRWRFLDNPLKQKFIQLAWDKEILAAHYAASPIIVSIDRRDYLTCISLTTMTHPEYRGLRLFPQLAKGIYEYMVKLDYLMIWGFPNNNSHRIFIKELLWEDIYEIPTMRLALNQGKIKCSNNIITDNHFDLDYSEINSSQAMISVKKDIIYLQWRYVDHPTNKYTNLVLATGKRVSSFCIVKEYCNALDIIDFQAKDYQEGKELIKQVLSFAYQNKLDYVNCWSPRHHFLHPLFEKLGFVNKEPITYLGFRRLSHDMPNDELDNYTEWYIQMGDSDVY
jgi:hypothetical protein